MINNLVLESKYAETMVNLKSLGDCDLCFEFAHLLSNFITLDGKRNLQIRYHLTQMLHCLASKHAAVT